VALLAFGFAWDALFTSAFEPQPVTVTAQFTV
jgi:hypothetical protein